jgi:hypothetical protein
VAKYRIGQAYKRGTIIGIDEELGKIVVFHKDMPPGALTVLKSNDASRYEKGFSIADAQGHELGIVHAVDRRQNLLVLNRPTLVAPVQQQQQQQQHQQQPHANSHQPMMPALAAPSPSPPSLAPPVTRIDFKHSVKTDHNNNNNNNNNNRTDDGRNGGKLFISVGNGEETKTSAGMAATSIPSPISMESSGIVF